MNKRKRLFLCVFYCLIVSELRGQVYLWGRGIQQRRKVVKLSHMI